MLSKQTADWTLYFFLADAPPAAPVNPAQGVYGPSMAQQPLAYQPQPQATFMQPPMAPMQPATPPAIPPVMPSPMGAFQNDELGNEAGLLPSLGGNQANMETGLSDASLMNAFKNESQGPGLQNDKLPPSEQSNFFPPPPADEQPPLADAPASEPPAANPVIAPQSGWERSSTVQYVRHV